MRKLLLGIAACAVLFTSSGAFAETMRYDRFVANKRLQQDLFRGYSEGLADCLIRGIRGEIHEDNGAILSQWKIDINDDWVGVRTSKTYASDEYWIKCTKKEWQENSGGLHRVPHEKMWYSE